MRIAVLRHGTANAAARIAADRGNAGSVVVQAHDDLEAFHRVVGQPDEGVAASLSVSAERTIHVGADGDVG